MFRSSTRRTKVWLGAVGTLFCCLITIANGSAIASLVPLEMLGLQKPGKLITRELPRTNDPVEIIDLKVGVKEAPLNKHMELGEEWLKDVSFKLKNVSSKKIVYAVVELSFPESKETGNLVVWDLRLGRRPTGEMNPAKEPLDLEPGKAAHFSLARQFRGIRQHLERRQPLGTFNTVKIRPYVIYFEDGTQWSGGDYFRPDPTKPGGYSKMADPPRKAE